MRNNDPELDAADRRYESSRANGAWHDPIPLPQGLAPVDAFKPEMLPDAIAPWIMDISDRMQCAPDYLAVAALVGLGTVLGRKMGIHPQQNTDWVEVANLWGCVVGRPGSMKTPAIDEALRPLNRLGLVAAEDFGERVREYEKERAEWKLRKDVLEQLAKKELRRNSEAQPDCYSTPEPEPPAEKRYVTNDSTYEKLGEIHAQNPNGILTHRDEIVSLLKTLDRDEYAAARGFYLTGWGGKTPYKFDRITRGKTHLEAVCLSVLGTTQPGKLAEYVRRAVVGGRGDDGLIQRFGLLVWPEEGPSWKDVDRYPDSGVRERAWGTFDSFDSLDTERCGALTSPFNPLPCLGFDYEAHGLFLEWRTHLESRIRGGELAPALESHLAKYRKLVPALALINQLADVAHGPVDKDSILKALAMARYLESHAKRAYASGPEAEVAAAKLILKHIRAGDLADGFTARDVHRPQWSRLTERDVVQAGLTMLAEYHWIAATDRPPSVRGGRPTTVFTINPMALQ